MQGEGGGYSIAARRHRISEFKTGLLDGTFNGVAFFAQHVLPLVQAIRFKDRFAVADVVKDYSPIMSPERLSGSTTSLEEIRKAEGSSVRSPCRVYL